MDGVHSSYARDINVGDDVVATFAGQTLTKLEVSATGGTRGEVTKVNTSTNTLTVRTFSNDTRTVQFNSSVRVVKNGTTYNSLSAINVGDRILVGSLSGSQKEITVMNSKTADVRYATSGLIQFWTDELTYSYKTINGCYCHDKGSTRQFTLNSLNPTGSITSNVTIYYTDRNSVYEVVRN